MTKGEAKALKTEALVYPMNLKENQGLGMEDVTINKTIVEEKTVNVNIKDRFARLKKSLRKRSVSIL